MAKITRKQLSIIIKEELEAVIVDEGLVDTFRALGSGLKKFYKDAEVTGEIEASKRATQAAGRQLTDRRDRFKAALDRETDPDRKAKIEQEINTLNAMINGLSRGGEKAKEVHTALADASDGKVEDPDLQRFDKADADIAAALARKQAKDKESDSEKKPAAPAAAPAKTEISREELLKVMKYLGKTYPAKTLEQLLQNLREKGTFTGKPNGIGPATAARRASKETLSESTLEAISTNSLVVPRSMLREVISLINNDES